MGLMRYGARVALAVLSGRRWGRLAAVAGSRLDGTISQAIDPSNRLRPAPLSVGTRVILASAVFALVAGACGGDSSPTPATAASTSAPPSSTSISTTSLSVEQAAVFDAYLRCWQAYIDFGTEQTRSFTRAEFDTRAGGCVTGDQYTKLLHAFSNGRPQGVFFRGPPIEHDPRPEVDLNGANATVRDCMLDQGEVFDADDGRVLEEASGERIMNVASLVQVDGAWRISGARDDGPCVA
jgi:hypothetical protein